MPALAPITVNDGEDTPVAHTFEPRGTDPQTGVTRFRESDGVPIGDNMLSISLRESGSRFKGRTVLAIPTTVTETVNGVANEVVLRTAYCTVELTFDQSSTTLERKNAIRIASNLIAGNALVDSTFIDLEGIY